jgi:hypothetical protein
MNSILRSRWQWLLWLVSLCSFWLITQPGSLYFLNDDFIYVPQSIKGQYVYRTSFRPVSDISILLDFLVYGKDGSGYHYTNLLFHLAATALVFACTRRWLALFSTQSMQAGVTAHMAALLFLVYPFHSESIFWIIGRGGSLVTIFFLGALYAIMHKQTRWYHWLAANGLLVLGLLTYESSWLLPPAMSAVVWLLHREFRPKNRISLYGLFVALSILILSFVLRKLQLDHFIGSPYLNTDKFQLNLWKQAYNFSTGFFRSFLPPTQQSLLFLALACLVLILLLVAAGVLIRKRLLSLPQWLPAQLFLLCLAPVTVLAVNTHTSESERFLYLPSAFLCMFVAMALQQLLSQRARLAVLIFMMLGSLYFYGQAARAYQVASQWNRTTLQHLAHYGGQYDSLHVHGLPTQYQGGFMFRLGFEEAVKWICPQVEFKKLVVHSREEVRKPNPLVPADEAAAARWGSRIIPQQPNSSQLQLWWKSDTFFVFRRTLADQ